MSGFQMRTQQEDKARVGVIRRRPVKSVPESVAGARTCRTDVGVAVVAINAPGVQHALVVDQFMTRPPNVVHDLIFTAFRERFADATTQIIEHFVPGRALPFAFAALACATERVENAFRIIYLVDRRRAFGAVAAAAAGMRWIALKFLDTH